MRVQAVVNQVQKQGPGHRKFPAAASLQSGEAVQAGEGASPGNGVLKKTRS